jgi:UDP-N-acetylmuramoyl-L-alanyl-D-glutamate--2,6-diaminopimelate ligase
MKLKKIFKEIPLEMIKGSKEVEITGICANSKLVAPGNLFIAKKGMTSNGARYIADAVAAGAVAILTDIYDPFLEGVVQLVHPDSASIEAKLAAHYYDSAHEKLFLVGVTGTNGKTTCSLLARHLLEGEGISCGLIGTVEWIIGKQILPATHTTPDLLTNHKLFYEMVHNGCGAAAMEVSSHALAQERVKGILFDVGIFTNLTLDHLDYHKTMEAYAEAKSKLFPALKRAAVINADDPFSALMREASSVPVFTYGIEAEADVRASHLRLSPKGMEFTVTYEGQSQEFSSHLIGRFNVYNLLTAISLGLVRGHSLEKIASLLSTFKKVPGRLEKIANKKGLNIFVDYAHTDDALKNVLSTLNEIKKGRVITVFGCGGDRDRTKRAKMGQVVEELSDLVVITSDNPRSEDPQGIVQEILKGIKSPQKVFIELDRKEAIELAIKRAKPSDIVLIAGKGHETYQIFSHQTIDFDDRKVAAAACNKS